MNADWLDPQYVRELWDRFKHELSLNNREWESTFYNEQPTETDANDSQTQSTD